MNKAKKLCEASAPWRASTLLYLIAWAIMVITLLQMIFHKLLDQSGQFEIWPSLVVAAIAIFAGMVCSICDSVRRHR